MEQVEILLSQNSGEKKDVSEKKFPAEFPRKQCRTIENNQVVSKGKWYPLHLSVSVRIFLSFPPKDRSSLSKIKKVVSLDV